jgi:hypothetical protein
VLLNPLLTLLVTELAPTIGPPGVTVLSVDVGAVSVDVDTDVKTDGEKVAEDEGET